MGKFGVSYLEVLILVERWIGHRLLPEKTVPRSSRGGRAITPGSPPISDGVQIRLGCQFIGSLFRCHVSGSPLLFFSQLKSKETAESHHVSAGKVHAA